MAVPQKVSNPPGKSSSSVSPGVGSVSQGKTHPDETLILTTLKNLVAAGEHRLDPILAAIADAALQLTGASGVALAMWKDGAMVCRARSGKTAPALGARLSADTGISGECLRTGKLQHCPDSDNDPLVDAEVCRALGLRSIAVLPIQGWRGVNGILEAFSTAPAAFTRNHLAILEQLAALSERARASQPHGASPVVAKLPLEHVKRPGLLPASDRVGDVALALVNRRSRPLVLGALGLAVIVLLAFVIWLGWRGRDDGESKAHAAAPLTTAAQPMARPVGIGTHGPDLHVADTVFSDRHLPDSDSVWKPNPGGQPLFPLPSKPSAGKPAAAKADTSSGKSREDRSLLSADAVAVALPQRMPGSDTRPDGNASGVSSAEEVSASSSPADRISLDQFSASPSDTSALNGVFSAKVVLPGLHARLSQGLSGGQPMDQVPPAYPPQAKMLHLEGKVILDAMVMEDGSVRDIKVVKGEPILARAAVEAVKQWRYRPFVLDGKPVARETTISVDFKPPSSR